MAQQLSLADVCKLQYQLSLQPHEEKKDGNQPSENQQTSIGSEILNLSEEEDLIRINLSRGRMVKPFYENDIDPIEYIKSGELVLFPNKRRIILNGNELIIIQSERENNETLTSSDLIEYYRAFPNFNWSRYPQLYGWIMNNLTKDEHESVLKLVNEYKSFHQKEKQFMTDYRKFISQFSLTEWFSELIDSLLFNNASERKSDDTSIQSRKAKQIKDSTKISKEFMEYIFPYISLLGIMWLLRKLFQLLKR